jgi:hypothetical protein
MFPLETVGPRELLEATVTAVSILGGAMAYTSGYSASRAMQRGHTANVLSQRVNEGIGQGFAVGWPVALIAFIIEIWI